MGAAPPVFQRVPLKTVAGGSIAKDVFALTGLDALAVTGNDVELGGAPPVLPSEPLQTAVDKSVVLGTAPPVLSSEPLQNAGSSVVLGFNAVAVQESPAGHRIDAAVGPTPPVFQRVFGGPAPRIARWADEPCDIEDGSRELTSSPSAPEEPDPEELEARRFEHFQGEDLLLEAEREHNNLMDARQEEEAWWDSYLDYLQRQALLTSCGHDPAVVADYIRQPATPVDLRHKEFACGSGHFLVRSWQDDLSCAGQSCFRGCKVETQLALASFHAGHAWRTTVMAA